MNTQSPVSLPEEDYLAILDITRRLHQCETRKDLRACITNYAFPLFQSETSSYGWVDTDLIQGRIIPARAVDFIGIPQDQLHIIEKMSGYFVSVAETFARSARQVIAYDIDIPREKYQGEMTRFFEDHPEFQPEDVERNKDVRTSVIGIDRVENLVIGFHRYIPNDQPFTLRDIRCLELLRPILLHTVKVVALNDELKTHKALVEALGEAKIPLALVSRDNRLLFGNAPFRQLISLNAGNYLPEALAEAIEQASEILNHEARPETSAPQSAFIKLPQGDFQLEMTRLKRSQEEGDGSWLVRLRPVQDPNGRFTWRLQKAGLTPREIEVCVLINDGFDDPAIAQRLFISPQTVKNHLKSIYIKLGVHSRTQLLARLKSSQ